MMYHQFTTRPEGEDGWLRGNYAYIGDFDAHMNHIATGGFYLPTWDELSAFIDGRLWLPTHSVIITDDDADQTWFDLAAPVVDKYKLLTTSFMITAARQDAAPNPTCCGARTRTTCIRPARTDRAVSSTTPCPRSSPTWRRRPPPSGSKKSWPTRSAITTTPPKQGLREAGFEMARTIEPGYVTIGTDKLALPVVRVNYGMNVDAITGLIG